MKPKKAKMWDRGVQWAIGKNKPCSWKVNKIKSHSWITKKSWFVIRYVFWSIPYCWSDGKQYGSKFKGGL